MYYRYKLEETSTAYLVVEAKDTKEASEKISNYLYDLDKSEEWRSVMDKNIDMKWTDVGHFSSLGDYNQYRKDVKGLFDHDIIVRNAAAKSIEKPWSMHIRFTDGSNPILYFKKTAKEIAELIQEWSVNYYLNIDKTQLLCEDRYTNWVAFVATLKEYGSPELILDPKDKPEEEKNILKKDCANFDDKECPDFCPKCGSDEIF